MSRIENVRGAKRRARRQATNARRRVRGAASHYACGASRRAGAFRERLGPRLGAARGRIAPRLDAARESLGPRLETARDRVRDEVIPRVSHTVTDEVIPRVATAWEASEPVREEAKARGALALAALKGEFETPAKRTGRRRGRLVAVLAVLAAIGGACAFWRSQSRRQEWLMAEAEAEEESAEEQGAATGRPAGPAGGMAWQDKRRGGDQRRQGAAAEEGIYSPEPNRAADAQAGGAKPRRGAGGSTEAGT